jgi:hypothetical protein
VGPQTTRLPAKNSDAWPKLISDARFIDWGNVPNATSGYHRNRSTTVGVQTILPPVIIRRPRSSIFRTLLFVSEASNG